MQGYNFTERVRKVLAMAREEASRLHHEYVGTEHILLGLVREGTGVAAAMLQNLGVDVDAVRQRIEETVKKGKATSATGPDLPYTSRAKKVLELAMSEARELGHSYVGTEHLLLGLLREEKGIAAQVLHEAGVTTEGARAEMLRMLGTEAPVQRPGAAHRRARDVTVTLDAREHGAASPELARLDPFVGAWDTEGEMRGGSPDSLLRFTATDTYAWLPGGHFLLHRFDAAMPDGRVEGIEVIGYDQDTGAYPMHSFDSVGTASLMRARVEGDTWTFTGERLRFTGGFRDGGRIFSGRWEQRTDDGASWQPLMDMRLRRRDR